MGFESVDFLLFEKNAAGRIPKQSAETFDQGRLPGSVGSDQGEDFSILDPHRNVVDDVHRGTVSRTEIPDFKQFSVHR